ncbi:MAG: NifB/NifX family molybdenum-iron cluster-binding protein [Deltaproteobacteria bacterium]|nr:NifB/NifX family molybdenum-iron cluster-binding protein [Deltaproteobacteria bacterium]MBN2672103.1 NifB/NifX family molybdenum-iron cluster-binding protein [Deltaproteobacteria bacterium]
MKVEKRIAVAVESGTGLDAQVSQHFGRCPSFVLINTKDGVIDTHTTVENPHFHNHQPGMVPEFIRSQNANVILAGGMGPKAVNMFSQMGIEVATGAIGRLQAVVEAYLEGKIKGIVPCSHDHPNSCGGH